ncbi:hypothetical protein LDENG_00298620 [Lucifuga dentata]|nr:hypothetical protein LDENG_00298620 [Lucifuga dentata]
MGMNLLITAAKKEARRPRMESGVRQPPIRGYINNLTITTATHVEARWLGIPPSFTSAGLYIRSGQLQLPLSSVVEELKVAKCTVVLTFRDSQDNQVNASVVQAETMLKLRDII